MKAKNHKGFIDAFAKFLIILSFFIFAIGFSYQSGLTGSKDGDSNSENIDNNSEPISTISITPSNGSDVVTNDDSIVPQPIDNGNTNNNDNNVSGNNNLDNNSIKNDNTTGNSNGTSAKVEETSLDDINAKLCKEIEKQYNIDIQYGEETFGYSVANITTVPITNPSVINSTLIRLKNILNLYPKGMFDEIRNGGIPLTIVLLDSYVDYNITGVTDSSYSSATISLAVKYPLEETFYHESYHYIERYMFKKGANFNTWNSLNPEGFTYGTIYNGNSYSNTFSEDAPFVNNYAQTDDREDRASTFEYMMATSKASCLNNGQTVWKKAMLMSRTIDAVFDSVSPSTIEYWERFL